MRVRVAGIAVGIGLLVGVSLLVDADYLRRALLYAVEHPLGLGAAFLAYTGAFALRVPAWRALIPAPVPPPRLFSLLLAALFLNHAAPAKAGDFARMYGLSRLGVDGGRAAASVILARLADLGGLLMVLAGAWALAGGSAWGMVVVPAAVVLLAGVGVWAFARGDRRIRLGPLAGPLSKLRGALRTTEPRTLVAALLWAVPAWVLEAGILVFVARGVGLELSVAEAVAAACFAVLLQAVPLTPGGLGTYEAGMVFALAAAGVPPGPAFAAAVGSHALKFLYAFAAAPFAAYEGLSAARTPELEEVKVR